VLGTGNQPDGLQLGRREQFRQVGQSGRHQRIVAATGGGG
jgi:hypothetical protein